MSARKMVGGGERWAAGKRELHQRAAGSRKKTELNSKILEEKLHYYLSIIVLCFTFTCS